MKSIINTIHILAFCSFVFMVAGTSCGVPDPPKAEITVLDSLDERVEGATVILLCTPVDKTKCVLGDTAETNEDGISEHEVKYESVLQIYAYKEFNQASGTVILSGESYIELKEGETAKETVVIEAD